MSGYIFPGEAPGSSQYTYESSDIPCPYAADMCEPCCRAALQDLAPFAPYTFLEGQQKIWDSPYVQRETTLDTLREMVHRWDAGSASQYSLRSELREEQSEEQNAKQEHESRDGLQSGPQSEKQSEQLSYNRLPDVGAYKGLKGCHYYPLP